VGKGWSIFFAAVLFGTFIIWPAAVMFGWWLPENVASFGDGVDKLFYLILGFTTFFFVLTEMVQVYAMWKFASPTDKIGEATDQKATYTHGNHRLEVLWTAVPAAILLFIAVAQIHVWSEIKYQKSMPSPDLTVTVLARQWEWRMRYPLKQDRFSYPEIEPGDSEEVKKEKNDKKKKAGLEARGWAENPEFDDVHVPNEIHCYMKTPEEGANVKMYLRTQDVLHSFTLPNLRLKQDTLPGKTIPMWFRPTRSNCHFEPERKDPRTGQVIPGRLVDSPNKTDHWEIACQELCGGRHYAMRGRLYVHRDKASYDAWLKHARDQQESRQPDKVARAD
jgi:cytochrome c oxidase subunit 2